MYKRWEKAASDVELVFNIENIGVSNRKKNNLKSA